MAVRRTHTDKSNYDHIIVHGHLGRSQASSPPPPTLPKKKKNSVLKSEPSTTAAVVNKAPPLPPFKPHYGGNSTGSLIPHTSLSLADFVKNYSNSLPTRVVVKEGFCSDDERSVISSGDVFNLHFIKKENVMSIKDAGGTNFTVPLNTAIQFGLVYNPVGDTKQAKKGYSFETAGELADYRIPPKIIRVTRKFDTGDSKSSIEKNEILIVKNVSQATLTQRQCVKVHSLLTKSDKTLYSDCRGCFLTDPGSVRLYLTDIYEFFKDELPLRAMIFLNSDVTDDTITHLASEIITLTCVSVELSIIATCAHEEEEQIQFESENEIEQDCPISIPINLDIVVDIINDDECDYEELYGNTMHLFDNFNPSKVKSVSSAMTLPTNCSTSERKEVKEGYQFGGLKIERPAAKTFPRNTVSAEDFYVDMDGLTSVQDSKDATKKLVGQKVPLTGPRTLPTQHVGSLSSNKKPVLPPMFTDKDSPYHEMIKHPESAVEWAGGCQTVTTTLESNNDTTGKLSLLVSSFANLSQRVDQLQEEVTQLKQEMSGSRKHSDRTSSRDESSDMNSNMKSLRSLSNSEVLQLLDKMNLSQYKEVFEYEQIDGDTLADCDEGVLLNELSVKNKLHRGRLMKIITGKNSAKTVLKGQIF